MNKLRDGQRLTVAEFVKNAKNPKKLCKWCNENGHVEVTFEHSCHDHSICYSKKRGMLYLSGMTDYNGMGHVVEVWLNGEDAIEFENN